MSRLGLLKALGQTAALGAAEMAQHVRERTRRWLIKALLGVDLGALDQVVPDATIEASDPPLAADDPLLGAEAAAMIAPDGKPRSPDPYDHYRTHPFDPPLEGSAQTRLERLKLR